jgi:hypothetical protein
LPDFKKLFRLEGGILSLLAQRKYPKKEHPAALPFGFPCHRTQAGQFGNSLRYIIKGSEARTSASLLTGFRPLAATTQTGKKIISAWAP